MFLSRLFSALFFWRHTDTPNGLKALSVDENPGLLHTGHISTSPSAHLLYIAVPSMIEDRKKRDTIRSTWARTAAVHRIPVRFYLGNSNCSKINKEIQGEAAQHGDMVITKYEDLWNNKVRKMFVAMQDAVRGQYSSEYFAFIEDATYVHVDRLVGWLKERRKTVDVEDKLYGGRVMTGNTPVRSPLSIYHVSEHDLPDAFFPPYAESVGFFMSRSAAIALLAQQDKRLMLHIDDVTIGCWLDRMQKEGRYQADFVNVGMAGIGPQGYLMVPGRTPDQMVEEHEKPAIDLRDEH